VEVAKKPNLVRVGLDCGELGTLLLQSQWPDCSTTYNALMAHHFIPLSDDVCRVFAALVTPFTETCKFVYHT